MAIPVSLLSCSTYELEVLLPAVRQLMAALGGMEAIVRPGDRVLLKPNLLTGSRPTQDCTTRPEVVYCVAKLVLEAGGQPFLGDSPAFGSACGVAEANGYLPLMASLGIPIVELHGQRYPTGRPHFQHLLVSKEAMAADMVINLPKVKSHVQLTLTLGVKNLFGCVPGKMKAWWHMEAGKDPQRFAAMLVETAQTIRPELTLVDGIIGHEGNGPSNGDPRPLGLLAACQNVFALDQVLVDILGVEAAQVPTLVQAERLGLSVAPSQLVFPELTPEAVRINDWRLPDHLMPIDFGLPRVVRSTFRHLYIRFIQEPMAAYTGR